jgi:hypothetical protein
MPRPLFPCFCHLHTILSLYTWLGMGVIGLPGFCFFFAYVLSASPESSMVVLATCLFDTSHFWRQRRLAAAELGFPA